MGSPRISVDRQSRVVLPPELRTKVGIDGEMELVVAGAFLLTGVGYFWMISHAWKVMRFIRTSICRRQSASDRRKGPDDSYAGPERRSGEDRRAQPVTSAVEGSHSDCRSVDAVTPGATPRPAAHPPQTHS